MRRAAFSGAGVPVYAQRGPGGGFELLEGFRSGQVGAGRWWDSGQRAGRGRRATVRISAEGRRLAAVLDRLQPIRVQRGSTASADGWVGARIRLEAVDRLALDVLSLGPEIEVIGPSALRDHVADLARATAGLYGG